MISKLPVKVMVSSSIIRHAESIMGENYKVNTPPDFYKHVGTDHSLKIQLCHLFNCPYSKIDYVFFSCREGAEPHVDSLNLSKFKDETIIIPIILPKGDSVLRVGKEAVVLERFRPYRFNHQTVHSLELEDKESGCVLVMAAVLK